MTLATSEENIAMSEENIYGAIVDTPEKSAKDAARRRRVRDEHKSRDKVAETPGDYSDTESDEESVIILPPVGDHQTEIESLKELLSDITHRDVKVSCVVRKLNAVRAIDIELVILFASGMMISGVIGNLSRFQTGCVISRHARHFLESDAFELACRFQEMKREVYRVPLCVKKKRLQKHKLRL